jgi:NAD(P)-dependent dehydrogenase (short-subunit alcohol dehydrogenase family)
MTSKGERSVLITGASTGIGRACALHLAARGFVVFAGVRNTEAGDALRRESPDTLRPVTLDVTEPDTIQRCIEEIGESGHPLFGLVNNAGVGISGVLEATPESELRRLLDVNVIGLHAVTRACLPSLRRNAGRVINIGSLSGFLAGPGAGSYAASKFAVRAITDSLRLEVQAFGMCVSLVAPGAVASDIWAKAKEYKKELRKTVAPELLDAYRPLITAGDKMVDTMRPIPAVKVAKTVEHGLTSRRPKYVYVVGPDARMARLFARLPQRLMNRLITRRIARMARSR